jgi:hypothetical protein
MSAPNRPPAPRSLGRRPGKVRRSSRGKGSRAPPGRGRAGARPIAQSRPRARRRPRPRACPIPPAPSPGSVSCSAATGPRRCSWWTRARCTASRARPAGGACSRCGAARQPARRASAGRPRGLNERPGPLSRRARGAVATGSRSRAPSPPLPLCRQVHGKSHQHTTLPRHYCSCQAYHYEVVCRSDAPYVSGRGGWQGGWGCCGGAIAGWRLASRSRPNPARAYCPARARLGPGPPVQAPARGAPRMAAARVPRDVRRRRHDCQHAAGGVRQRGAARRACKKVSCAPRAAAWSRARARR